MIWIEMSRDEMHGGGDWSFGKSIWAPSHVNSHVKKSTRPWRFWKNILSVEQGDIILHLRGGTHQACICGYSIAATSGYETHERPPYPGRWGYCESFYRVILEGYTEFDHPILLDTLFREKHVQLMDYLASRQMLPTKNLFFTYQSNRIQCLNGAYFSPVSDDLLQIIFGQTNLDSDGELIQASIPTSEVLSIIKQRRGQENFSKNVKTNYNHCCCFPGCQVSDNNYLVASHIARWADNPELRGEISNGLCLCLVHDKAFERGYFSLDDEYKVLVNYSPQIQQSNVFKEYIQNHAGEQIKLGKIVPSKKALSEHRSRNAIRS